MKLSTLLFCISWALGAVALCGFLIMTFLQGPWVFLAACAGVSIVVAVIGAFVSDGEEPTSISTEPPYLRRGMRMKQ